MSNTPEGKVKKSIKEYLKLRRVASFSAPVEHAAGYYHMYVPAGYGDPTLDFTGCYKGRYFSIETKANGNTPTPRQKITIGQMADAEGFVIWGDDAEDLCKRLGEFFDFIDEIRQQPVGVGS